MTAGSWDGKSGHTSVKRRQLKNRKEARMSSLKKATPGEGTRGERPSGRHKLGPGRECQPYWQWLARTGTGKAGRNQTLQDIEAYCDATFMESEGRHWRILSSRPISFVCIFKPLWHYLQSTSRLLAIAEDDCTGAHSCVPGLEQTRQENAGTSGL